MCLRVHRGYKCFNFNRRTVIKSIKAEVRPDQVASEIAAVRKASFLSFAPKISNWNIDDRWYQEDFINGRLCHLNSGLNTAVTSDMVEREIGPIFEQMILLQKAEVVDINEYTNRLKKTIFKRMASTNLMDKANLAIINRFVQLTIELICFKKIKIPLVFSHGDFSMVNILNTKFGKRVIDWEGASLRNPLYDLYNFFLTELYYGRAAQNSVTAIKEAILVLQSRLKSKVPSITRNFMEDFSIHRRLYYVERICFLSKRELNKNVIKVIFRSIDIFKLYEKMIV
jgi:thiamine kinase-like enzyme